MVSAFTAPPVGLRMSPAISPSSQNPISNVGFLPVTCHCRHNSIPPVCRSACAIISNHDGQFPGRVDDIDHPVVYLQKRCLVCLDSDSALPWLFSRSP